MMKPTDFRPRATRYARLGVNAGALRRARRRQPACRRGGAATTRARFTEALGAMKGPMMKVAQLLATIPEALPADYSDN